MDPQETVDMANDPVKQDTSRTSLYGKFMARFVGSTQQLTQPYTDTSVRLKVTGEFNKQEMAVLTRRHYVQETNPTRNPDDLQLLNSLQPSHREIVSNIADAERLKALDPNIKRIEQIVVSSIMSPNDLQDVDPEIAVECTELNEEQKSQISNVLKEFYNGVYGLREKMTNWIKEAHFRSGAGVTIILPEATLTNLIEKYDPDRKFARGKGCESLVGKEQLTPREQNTLCDAVLTREFFEKVRDMETPSSKVLAGRAGAEGIAIGDNQRSNLKAANDGFEFAPTKRIVRAMMSELPRYRDDAEQKEIAALESAFESMTINFAKALSPKKDPTEQKFVDILANTDTIQVGKICQQQQQQKLHNLLEDSVLGKLMEENGTSTNRNPLFNYIPTMDWTADMTELKDQYSFPFTIDAPAEAFIPVCVPGSKKERVGGFLLTDSWGQPIEASAYINAGNSGNPMSDRISVAYNAMYGEMPTESGIRTVSSMVGGTGRYMNMNGDQANINKVFNYVLDEMLKRKLTDVGLTDVTLGNYNAIAQCMLYRLLDKKHTSLIFIPEKYLTYVAFDYHHDGTGKSRIEDILYMESLKISFMTANTLATMKSAVPVKKVKVNLDPKQKNTLQTLFMARDAILRREKFSPSIYPASITSQILAQNLSIETAHPNSENFSIQVEDSHREIPKADTEYLKELDNNSIIGLGVMPSAINEMSEVQFARSLATTNLYYAKSTRQDQVVVEGFATKHVRAHAMLSSVLVYKIAEILEDTKFKNTTDRQSDDNAKVTANTADGGTVTSALAKKLKPETVTLVRKVIDSLEVKLCPPDVAPNDTQYNILTEMIKRIDEYVTAIYPDDIGTYGDNDYTKELRILRASVKAAMIREVANNLGFRGLLSDVPELEQFILENGNKIVDAYGILHGFSERMKREQQARLKKDENVQDTGGTDTNSEAAW